MHKTTIALAGIIAMIVVILVAVAALGLCPPPGPYLRPPWCGNGGAGFCAGETCTPGAAGSPGPGIPFPAFSGPASYNITVTVPYWTTGDVYIGIGDNASYAALARLNEVIWQGTVSAQSGSSYYYSRGSQATREAGPARTLRDVTVLDGVTDWQDSAKTILKKDFQKSFYLGACHTCDVSFTKGNFIEPMKQSMDEIRAIGGTWVNIVPGWFIVPDYRGSLLRPIYAADFTGTSGWVVATIADQDITTLIDEAHARGLKVYLVPHLSPEYWGPGVKGKGDLMPADPDMFFENYTRFITHYADIAQASGTEMFGIGNELDTLTQTDIATSPAFDKDVKWRGVIAAVRDHYTGQITYSVSCMDERRCGPELIPFWDAVDVIGWEWYVPIASGPHEPISSMKANAERIIANHMKPLADKYRKPVVITEIGWEAYPGACAHTYGTGPSKSGDRVEQASCYEAMFQAIEDKDFIRGTQVWTWTAGLPGRPFAWVKTDAANEVRFSITQDEIAKWYGKIQT
jgi:hypothetical protein